MASRDPKLLTPEMYEKYLAFDSAMDTAGIDYILTCTRRTQAEQDALYAQGRTKPGRIVTWTRKSKHIEGVAFDIAIMKNGKISWAPGDYLEAGEIGMQVGLSWGGAWARNKDYPHFELKVG
jgi:peptidoglycan LD-endopeptidase CwlK